MKDIKGNGRTLVPRLTVDGRSLAHLTDASLDDSDVKRNSDEEDCKALKIYFYVE